jgi:hypothetical protein
MPSRWSEPSPCGTLFEPKLSPSREIAAVQETADSRFRVLAVAARRERPATKLAGAVKSAGQLSCSRAGGRPWVPIGTHFGPDSAVL